MSFLEYVYNLDLESLAHGSNGVKHKHEETFIEVARNRMSAADSCDEVRESIREIVANLIGCEDFALFEIDYSKAVMWPRWSFGANAEMQKPVDLIAHPELNPVLQGRLTIYASPHQLHCFPNAVSALVPMAAGNGRQALLALFGLLPQKSWFNETDRCLLEVLELHGGRALSSKTYTFHMGDK